MLGGLVLEPSDFTRPKPLLLLAYLSLEGPRSRREVADLFWQGNKDPMQGLRMALLQLNKEAPEAIKTDEKRVWTDVETDVAELRALLTRDDLLGALHCYRGAFIDGFDMQDIGEELEEWIFKTREEMAGTIRDTLLELAEAEAAKADFRVAASRAAEAYLLRFAPEPDDQILRRIYTLLRTDENPQADSVAKEAKGYDLELSLTPEAARQQFLVGTTLRRRATDLVEQPAVILDNPLPNTLMPSNPTHQPVLPRARTIPRRRLALLGLIIVLGSVLAFFGLRPRPSSVVVGDGADDADVSLDNGDNYFCFQQSNLYLSSPYKGQSTALRFRDVNIPKGGNVNIQSALILFTASAHVPQVPEGSGFIVRGLFDSSPWLVNDICEQIHPPAGNNYVSRVRTQTSVVYKPKAWNITQQYGVDVTSIVQEMVNSPDWTGDGVAFAIDNLQVSTADLRAYSNEGGILLEDLSKQPQFVVTFSTN